MSGFLCLAALCDLAREKIPNTLILIGLFAGLMICLADRGLGGIQSFVWKALWPVLLLFLLFLIRALGAGDLKLFSVISVFLPTGETMHVITVSFLLGAIVSFVRILFQRQTRRRLVSLMTYVRSCVAERKLLSYETPELPGSYLHFAVCICMAFWIIEWMVL